MSDQRVLLTGALGCIGAWAVRMLVRDGVDVSVFDLADDAYRMRLIMTEEEIARVRFIRGDITFPTSVDAAFAESKATHVIHLAGLQIPACRANPVLGARVNVVGTVNVFEAARKFGIGHLAYASSIGVYGPPEDYPPGPILHDAPLLPRTLYGVFKQADEGIAKVYWYEHGFSSIGLRPYIVYGPGRDQGLTSSPTKAMLAAAAGQPYHIPYGGRADMQYAPDIASAFIQAMNASFAGAEAFNNRGSVVTMGEVVAAIEAVLPAMRGQITFDDGDLPYSDEMDDSALRAVLGDVPSTSLQVGVAETITLFETALASGRIAYDAND